MTSPVVIQKLGYGPVEAQTQFFSSAALSTTPTKVTLPTVTNGGASVPLGVKVKIVNGHATNTIAWALVKNGAAAPTITADYVNATTASIILPTSAEFFTLYWGASQTNANTTPWFDLYVVASGASTTINVTWDIIY